MHMHLTSPTTSSSSNSSRRLPVATAISALCACLSLCACDASRVYDRYSAIPAGGWHKDSSAVFDVYVSDTASLNSLYVNLRHTSSYPFCNIYLFVKATAPSGATTCDTVEYMLADPYGRWYGKGFSSLIDNRLAFRKHVRFPRSGTYRFEVWQGMRMDALPHVTDVGLRIEKQQDYFAPAGS
ncbi:MAG: gliding motility lipoprotein GldH [Prevotellaceae bacterium]|jgi:gliding motility-associated lipoprotein GldH|nr:gliding motility lipoprotein GldH [Prevotellaceae bacterium]